MVKQSVNMEKYLAPDEQIVDSTFIHWKIFFIPSVFFTGWVILKYFEVEKLGRSGWIVEMSLIFFAILLFFRSFYRKSTTQFFITNRRILIKKGLISLSTKGMLLVQIESIDVDQSIFGRLFNYGDVTIHGTGTSKMLLVDIQKPFEFRKLLITTIKDSKN